MRASGGTHDAAHLRQSSFYKKLMRKETLHERVIIIGGQQILPYVVGDSAYLILTSSWPVVIKMPKNLASTWKK